MTTTPAGSPTVLQKVADSNPAAMQECMDRYSGLVWSLARKFCRAPEDAEDACQEIFLDIWKSAARFDPTVASETTFVAMIARRRLIDRQRRRSRTLQPAHMEQPEILPEEPGPDRVEIKDEADRIEAALETLRPEQRHVIHMALLEGRTHREISTDTGMPLGTVKSLARRGLIRVREMLGVSRDGGLDGNPGGSS